MTGWEAYLINVNNLNDFFFDILKLTNKICQCIKIEFKVADFLANF